MEPKTLMERPTSVRNPGAGTSGTMDSAPGGCLTVSKNPSIFRTHPEETGENPGEYPGLWPVVFRKFAVCLLQNRVEGT